MVKYLATMRALERRFYGFTLKYIPRAENLEADQLAKAMANNLPMPEGTFYQKFEIPAIIGLQKAFKEFLITESEDWR